jgi:hypothetical protein
MADSMTDTEREDEDRDGEAMPSEEDAAFARIKRWYHKDAPVCRKWRKEAEEDYAFYNGDHWTDEEKAQLREQMRPALTFNRVGVLVNSVSGSEINNRREVRYIPREQGDAQANEVLTSAAEWFRDQCEAEDEESDAFQDTVICGMGWTETRLDFDSNPDGDPKIERIDPLEMIWDTTSTKANIADAKRLFRVREIELSEARALFPDAEDGDLNAGWAQDHENSDPVDSDAADEYRSEDNDTGGKPGRKCKIVECQWIEFGTGYRLPDPNTGELTEGDAVMAREAKKMGLPVQQYRKRMVKRAFIGTKILEMGESPCGKHFSYEAITGYRDHATNTWYGIVRPTKDPQRWANKFLSQVMHIMNSSAKGGVMAERGAFEDDRQAETSWARTDAITWLERGAISGQAPKVAPKPVAGFPTGFFQLMQYAVDSIRDVTGINLELLGMREVNQPGVLEMQRRQAGLTILAGMFNALRRYRKRQGRLMLHLIQTRLADGRLVRIVGDEKAQYVPLMRENVANIEFDIIVDDTPTSPNEKERNWAVITALLPFLKDFLDAETALEIAKYSPLPASMVEKLAKKYEQTQEANAPKAAMQEQMAMQAAMIEMQNMAADTEAKKAKAFKDMADAADKMIEVQYGKPEPAPKPGKPQSSSAGT